ncbi:Similar to Trappc1: Trafficking protein particle complex subunit 1 (Rattus norvegicus) [Cotesia congregata]|uniref:Trafficking protein particle complex subunit n=1 Tax=Cotesia congregata TaxID=51543 RepID=A0A8J2H0G9_COTCN|nr:Similar to Trappc1: Trafficking protein particle complex subunit 1 (Rattus norvegicus) [Cotesia congregata]
MIPVKVYKGFLYYKTSKYSLHYLETPSGLKFVLNTDTASQNVRELLQQLYRQVYVEYVVKNPFCKLNEPIQSELFKSKVDELMKKSPIFLNPMTVTGAEFVTEFPVGIDVGDVGVVELEAGLGSSITGKRLLDSLTAEEVWLWKKMLRSAATFVLSRTSNSNDSGSTDPARARVEAAPSSAAIEALTDFSDKLVAAEAVSLHRLNLWVEVTSAWTSNL